MKLRNRNLLAICIVLGVLYVGMKAFLPIGKNPGDTTSASASPTGSALPSPSVQPELKCVDESVLSGIAGKTYQLTQENPLPEIQGIECDYDANDQVNNLTPSIHYLLSSSASANRWDSMRAEMSVKPGFRLIDGKPNFFAYVNPVAELAQGTFYAKTDSSSTAKYVELTYSPIKEQVGVILDKGVQMASKVME